MHSYSSAQIDYLRAQYRRFPVTVLTWAFNQTFATALTEDQINGTLHRYRIHSGRTGRFHAGQAPWNTGKRGYIGANRTSFKKGQLPHNHRPLWSERIDKNGYIEMSVPERNPYTGFPTRFKHKHVWIWEQAHGQKPKGHAVIFLDSDNRNFDLDNLILVSRRELLAMNQHGYRKMPGDLKPSVLALAKLEAKAGISVCPGRGRKREKLSMEQPA